MIFSFYFRNLYANKLSNKDIAVINHMQKEILKTINQWSYVFYVPPILDNVDDGIRYQDVDQIKKIDRWIKSYIELENINHIDLSSVDLKKRTDYILKTITS